MRCEDGAGFDLLQRFRGRRGGGLQAYWSLFYFSFLCVCRLAISCFFCCTGPPVVIVSSDADDDKSRARLGVMTCSYNFLGASPIRSSSMSHDNVS